jgi:hypothetical protein
MLRRPQPVRQLAMAPGPQRVGMFLRQADTSIQENFEKIYAGAKKRNEGFRVLFTLAAAARLARVTRESVSVSLRAQTILDALADVEGWQDTFIGAIYDESRTAMGFLHMLPIELQDRMRRSGSTEWELFRATVLTNRVVLLIHALNGTNPRDRPDELEVVPS